MKLTKSRAQGIYQQLKHASATKLSDVYGHYSVAKERAYKYTFRILSGTCYHFTCAYTDDKNLYYYTSSYNYVYPLDKLGDD